MNVYHLNDDMEPEGRWVKLEGANGLRTFMHPSEEQAFFAAHPRIAVQRDQEASRKGSKAKLADMTRLGAFPYPVFSERAKALFEPHLAGIGQWIPLDFDEAPYWLFWLNKVRDALDAAASDIRHFPDGSGILSIERPTFRIEAVSGLFMWTTTQNPGSLICVTDEALDLVREHRLTGFRFDLLWSSQHGPLPNGLKNWQRPRFTGLEAEAFDSNGFWAAHREKPAARV